MMNSIKNAKKSTRTHARLVLSHLETRSKALQSQNALQQLINLPQFASSEKISVFIGTPEEVDTIPVIQHLIQQGKKVFVPRCYGKRSMDMIQIHDLSKLVKNEYGILEPIVTSEVKKIEKLDLIIVPGLAFNETCYRLGHGCGYYDYFFARYLEKYEKLPMLLGMGFKEQLLKVIPVEDHDFTLDGLVIDDRVIIKNRNI